jgi:hypothetical protein
MPRQAPLLLLTLTCSALPQLSQAVPEDQARLERALIALGRSEGQRDLQCAAERKAWDAIEQAKGGSVSKEQVRALRELSQSCRELTLAHQAAAATLASARSRQAAPSLSLDRHAKAATREAATLQVDLARQALAVSTLVVPKPEVRVGDPPDDCPNVELKDSDRTPGPEELLAVINKAKEAQGEVNKLQPELKGAWPSIDDTRKRAMALDLGTLRGAAVMKQAANLDDLYHNAAKAMRCAQWRVNALEDIAFYFRGCSSPSACTDLGQQHAKALELLHDERGYPAALKTVEKALKTFASTALEVTAAEARLNEAQRKAFFALEEGLSRHPSVRSLLESDGIGLETTKGQTAVTLRRGWDIPSDLVGKQRFAFSLSTPLSKNGDTSLFDNVNGLADSRALGLAYGMARANPLGDALYRGMFTGVFEQRSPSYLKVQGADVQLGKQTLRPYTVGIELELLLFKGGASHVVQLLRQRSYEEGPLSKGQSVVRCPGGVMPTDTPMNCLSGPLGAPREVKGWTASWAYHTKLGVPIAPRLSYQTATKTSGLDLPIYLFGSGKKDEGPNAGLRLTWLRKAGEAGADAKTDFQFGLFIGAPFSLFSGKPLTPPPQP